MSDIQDPWASAMVRAGMTDPRNAQRPSWNALSRAADVHTSTLTAMVHGTRETGQDVIDRVATALNLDARVVADWVGRERAERAPYAPPSDANLLDREEREAVNRLILLLAKSKKRGQREDWQSDPQKSQLRLSEAGDMGIAAQHDPSHGKIEHDRAKSLGEESQDEGGW